MKNKLLLVLILQSDAFKSFWKKNEEDNKKVYLKEQHSHCKCWKKLWEMWWKIDIYVFLSCINVINITVAPSLHTDVVIHLLLRFVCVMISIITFSFHWYTYFYSTDKWFYCFITSSMKYLCPFPDPHRHVYWLPLTLHDNILRINLITLLKWHCGYLTQYRCCITSILCVMHAFGITSILFVMHTFGLNINFLYIK